MEKTNAFAIGCFHFGLKKLSVPSMNGQDYITELRHALETIPNANNITIDAPDEFLTEPIAIPDALLTLIREGADFFPPPSFGVDIDFDLYIPERLQREFYPTASKSSLPIENFVVHIRDSYHFPVTFIELIGATETSTPSDAVIVTREFLTKHFSENKSEFIRFDFLGPSPFHANFFLLEPKRKSSGAEHFGFNLEYFPEKGYDTFRFFFDKSLHSDMEDAKEHLFFELSDEAGMFYDMVHTNVLQMRQWERIDELLQELLKDVKAKGIKATWRKFDNDFSAFIKKFDKEDLTNGITILAHRLASL